MEASRRFNRFFRGFIMSKIRISRRQALAMGAAVPLAAMGGQAAYAEANAILNVSYDPTAALYADYNRVFTAYWVKKPARLQNSAFRMAAPAPRRGPLSKACRPTSSRWRSLTTSTPSPKPD